MRALLIQKSVKLKNVTDCPRVSLRALLIQKSVKREGVNHDRANSLRALLIQKSVKQPGGAPRAERQFESFVNSEECKTFCPYHATDL